MNRCPVEVWERIARLACIDGGYTACSLSLVSRSMRAITLPSRYYTVALVVTPDSCRAFMRLLESAEHPVVIHHLLITRGQEFDPSHFKEVQQSVYSILAAAAPTLRTLVAFGDIFASLFIFTSQQFPVLEDLSTPHMSSLPSITEQPRFPSLRRLHTSTTNGRHLWQQLGDPPPLLTHLRIADLDTGAYQVAFLRVLMDVPPPAEDLARGNHCIIYGTYFEPNSLLDEAAAYAAHFAELQHVLVDVNPFLPDLACSRRPSPAKITLEPGRVLMLTEEGEIDDLMVVLCTIVHQALEEIREATRSRTRRKLHLLPGAEVVSADGALVNAGYTAANARADWLDLVEGGEGPWKVPE